MKRDIKIKVRRILDDYLEARGYRKTPERYAILDAVYSIKGHFSLDQLREFLDKDKFKVSRATLYNTMRLFLKLGLVVRHKLIGVTNYEARIGNDNHCHQVCTVCGKVTEINIPEVVQAFENAKFKRFKKNGFILYIYGTCTTCQSR